jgi:hypothetical protein
MTSNSGALTRQTINTGLPYLDMRNNIGIGTTSPSSTYSLTNALNGNL